MSQASETVLIVRLHDGPPAALAGEVLSRLGLPAGSGPRTRHYAPELFTARVPEAMTPERVAALEALDGVAWVKALRDGDRLFHHAPGRALAPVAVGPDVAIGEDDLTILAGPCSVEGRAQVAEIAARVKEGGAHVLRGGAYKPRTSPYDFGGLGEEGLQHLAHAREQVGLPFVTEILDLTHLDVVADYADMLQIGSRNMHNSVLLFHVGAHRSGRPVLLKRGLGATLDETLAAVEYILLGRLYAGHEEPGVVICERGIRTFERSLRFTIDVGGIAVLRSRTPVPIIADPSHAAGDDRFVQPLALAAVAAGASGLLVEVASEPGRAWCDASQCLSADRFSQLVGASRQVFDVRRLLP
jgi:3-deoxy-7-phosphoheptulonate synthase